MRTAALAIAAGACTAAAYLLHRRLHSQKAAFSTEPARANVQFDLTVLPESILRENDARPHERSPLRALIEQVVTRRVLSAAAVVAGNIVIQLLNHHKPGLRGFIAHAYGIVVGMSFKAMLWPTDRGVRSQSWSCVYIPETFVRAIIICRVVCLELVYHHAGRGVVSYLHGGYAVAMALTLFILNVRGTNRWKYMRTLWFGRALIGLADVLVLRCTTRGPAGPFPPIAKGGGHTFAEAVGMTLFSMAFNGALTPANRLALSGLAERAHLTHVPVQLSQVTGLIRRVPWLHVQDDPRNVWAILANALTPAASEAASLEFTERASTAAEGSAHRPCSHAYTAKVGGKLASSIAPYEPDSENASAKAGGFALYEPAFENHPDLHAGVSVSSDEVSSDQALAQELVATAVARAMEDATSSAPVLATYQGDSNADSDGGR